MEVNKLLSIIELNNNDFVGVNTVLLFISEIPDFSLRKLEG